MKQTAGDGVVDGARDWISTQDMVPVFFMCSRLAGPAQFQPCASAKASTGAVAGWAGLIALLQVGI